MAFKRREEPTTIEDEREALRAQHAALEDLKRQLAERVDAVRERELELHHALAEAGGASAGGPHRPARPRCLDGRTATEPTPARTRSSAERRERALARPRTGGRRRARRSLAERERARERELAARAEPTVAELRRPREPDAATARSRSRPGSRSCARPRSSSSAPATSSPPAARRSPRASASSRRRSASSTTARTARARGRPRALRDGGAPAPARAAAAGRADARLLGWAAEARSRERSARSGRSERARYPVGARGVSSAGRAPPLQGGGRRFDPGTLHRRTPATAGVLFFGWFRRECGRPYFALAAPPRGVRRSVVSRITCGLPSPENRKRVNHSRRVRFGELRCCRVPSRSAPKVSRAGATTIGPAHTPPSATGWHGFSPA